MSEIDGVRGRLLRGVRTVTVPDSSGVLDVWGDDACVVLATELEGRPAALVAAARWGEGRVVAFGHDGMLTLDDDADEGLGALVRNALAWAANDARKPAVLVLDGADTVAWLAAQKFKAIEAEGPYAGAEHPAHDVVLCAGGDFSEEDRAALAAFVTGGGGLIVGGTGWAHPHYGRKERGVVVPMPQSALLAPAGIVWDEERSLPGEGEGTVEVDADPDEGADEGARLHERAHAGADLRRALAWLAGDEEPDDEDEDLSERTTRAAVQALRASARFGVDVVGIRDAVREAFERRAEELVPSPEAPLEASRRWDRALVFLETERWRLTPPDEEPTPVCPTADAYPGAVPDDAESEDATLSVDTSVARWVSTGRYARPGGVVEIELSDEALERGLRVRVGAHIDELYSEGELRSGCSNDAGYASEEGAWERWPELSFEHPLTDTVTRVGAPFGGLVYIVVPDDGEGTFEVTVRGAVAAPYFVLGETSVREWQTALRDAPAPWGEFACDRLIFTLPSEALRAVDDPEALMRFWDRTMQCYEELAGEPYRRPERVVGDRQTAMGYMHSGYPIVGLLREDEPGLLAVLDARAMVTDGSWGTLHELGHNQQKPAWTFEGTDEVTNNVFVLFVMHSVCGITPWKHPMLREAIARVKKYKRDGAPFAQWGEDPFLALVHYAQLQRAFGWQPFIDVFAEYGALPQEELPESDEAKRDQWLTRMSRRVGHDLGGFFTWWGVPTSERARAALRDLPAWMPPAITPADYEAPGA